MTNKFYARYLYKKLSTTGLGSPFEKLERYFKGNYVVLQFIYDHNNELTLKDIKNELKISGARITAIINRLVAKELVIKNVDSVDKRAYRLTITEKGKAVIEKNSHSLVAKFEELIEKVGMADVREYLRITNKIKHVLNEGTSNA